MADPAPISLLVPTLVTLDAIAQRGAGGLAVIPRAVNNVAASEYRGWQFVAWPKANFDAIVLAGAQLGFFGEPLIAPAASQAAALIDAGNNLQLAFVKRSVATVNEIRTRLRKQLEQLGVQLSPAPAPTTPTPTKKFPWSWVLGTLALGLAVGGLLFVAEKQNALPLPGDDDDE